MASAAVKQVACVVKAHGTPNQIERWSANLLPEDELLVIARTTFFEPFNEYRRWQKLLLQDLQHEKHCTGGHVAFSTRPPTDLTHDEWNLLKKIAITVAAANIGPLREYNVEAHVEPVEHVGVCGRCLAEVYGRAASIRIDWAGRPLSREYTLEAK